MHIDFFQIFVALFLEESTDSLANLGKFLTKNCLLLTRPYNFPSVWEQRQKLKLY